MDKRLERIRLYKGNVMDFTTYINDRIKETERDGADADRKHALMKKMKELNESSTGAFVEGKVCYDDQATENAVGSFFRNYYDMEVQFRKFLDFATKRFGFNIQVSYIASPVKRIRLFGSAPGRGGQDVEFTIDIPQGYFSISELLYRYENDGDPDISHPDVERMANLFAYKCEGKR